MMVLPILASALLITGITYFIKASNPVCNYSNSMTQSELVLTTGSKRGFPIAYYWDAPWNCSESGETARDYKDFEQLHMGLAFVTDTAIWFCVAFTVVNICKMTRKRK